MYTIILMDACGIVMGNTGAASCMCAIYGIVSCSQSLCVCSTCAHSLQVSVRVGQSVGIFAITCSHFSRCIPALICADVLAVSAQYIQSMLLQRGSKTALLPLPVDVGLTAAAKLGSSMLEFAVLLTGQCCSSTLFVCSLLRSPSAGALNVGSSCHTFQAGLSAMKPSDCSS